MSDDPRFGAFSDQELRCFASAFAVCYSEGIGGSGDQASDLALQRELLREAHRRGLTEDDGEFWWEQLLDRQAGGRAL